MKLFCTSNVLFIININRRFCEKYSLNKIKQFDNILSSQGIESQTMNSYLLQIFYCPSTNFLLDQFTTTERQTTETGFRVNTSLCSKAYVYASESKHKEGR